MSVATTNHFATLDDDFQFENINISFDDDEFKEITEKRKVRQEFVVKCCKMITYNILTARNRHGTVIQSSINKAKKRGKSSVNIFSACKDERMVELPNNKLYKIHGYDIEKGYINHQDGKINISTHTGESMVDLIRGSRHNKVSISSLLEENIKKCFWKDMTNQYNRDNKDNSDCLQPSREQLTEYAKEKGKYEPRIFIHYNKNWSTGPKNIKTGAFLIELDWSGDPNHKGMRPNSSFNKPNRKYFQKKNFQKNDESTTGSSTKDKPVVDKSTEDKSGGILGGDFV